MQRLFGSRLFVEIADLKPAIGWKPNSAWMPGRTMRDFSIVAYATFSRSSRLGVSFRPLSCNPIQY
jgi:hypothetical protein